MCILVICKQCEKYSWKGCGLHLPELYKRVEKGKHCACRPWPGVVVPPEEIAAMKPATLTNSTHSIPTGKATVKRSVGSCGVATM